MLEIKGIRVFFIVLQTIIFSPLHLIAIGSTILMKHLTLLKYGKDTTQKANEKMMNDVIEKFRKELEEENAE